MKLLRIQIFLHITGISDHAAELKNLDSLPALANTLLRIYRTARRLKTDERAHNRYRNEEHDAHAKAKHEIE